jgi:hypothetical protein
LEDAGIVARAIDGRTHRLHLDVGRLAGAGAWIETQPAVPETADGIEMSPEDAIVWIYPDGPEALPPELDPTPPEGQS